MCFIKEKGEFKNQKNAEATVRGQYLMIGCTDTVALHLLFLESPVNLAVLTGNRYISSKQDEGELKSQNNAQRHSSRPIPNDWIGTVLNTP
jgi:hypothetical protein